MSSSIRALLFCLFVCAVLVSRAVVGTQPAPPAQEIGVKPRILIHVTHGPEAPTRAALAFLVARTAIEEGHTVSIFLAGDAVQLIRDQVLDNLTGLGTGRLREQYDAIAERGGRFYVSGMSSNARGVTADDLRGKPAELAPPAMLLRLSLDHDRMFSY